MIQQWFYRLTLLGGLSLLPLVTVLATDVEIQTVTDLASLGETAQARKLPILIMFSQAECPYCTIMEENYLKPILRSGQYQDKVIIRQVRIDNLKTFTDFNGRRVEADHLTSRYHAWVTPTLIFLNGKGEEIAPKLVGIGTEGFFAGDIDNAIDAALVRVRSVALK